MNLKTRLKELLGAAVVAVLLGCSMSMTLLDALAVSFSVGRVVLTACLTALACTLLLIDKIPALVVTVCLSAGATIYSLRQENLMTVLKEAMVSLLMMLVGGESGVDEHAAVLVVIICVVLTLLAFMLTRLSGGVYPAMLLYLFVMLGSWFIEKRLIAMYIVPGLAGLAVLYARAHRENISYMKALPAALLAALLAAALIPAGDLTWQPLSDAAQKVRELFNDYFMFTDPRTVYSVSSDGYQPQGDVLGGPASPRDADVMTVKTDRMLLLRGSIRRTYTGYSWVDTSVNSRYLLIDPTRQAFRDKVFDMDTVPALRHLLDEVSVSVTMLNDGTSTLFVPGRLRTLSTPMDMPVYFNDSGEVFITRGVTYGDSYELTAYIPQSDWRRLAVAAAAVTPGSDPDYEAALDTHMNLPKGLDDDVYWLTQALTEDIESPVDKALALREHLLSAEYTYTLDVELPPKGRDFVSHFLLDTKEGYCTYYASAMAVMARLAGLPSRYVEGYLVHADPSGETLVRGENAHAWVEIYFEGLGWIPFDATPGRSGGGDHTGDTQQDENDTVPTPVPDADHEGDRPAQSEPTPTPTPEPTPTPTPESQHAPEHWAPTPTPDPSVQNDENSPEDDPSSEDEPSSRDRGWLRALLWILLILLVLLVLFALVRHRWIMRNPLTFDRRQESDEVRLLLWYRTMLTMLMRTGLVPEGGETPAAFARRAVESGVAPEALCLLAGAVERQQYARKPADEETVNQARALYVQMLGALSARERLRWYAYCMTKGTGSFSQIP